MRTRLKTVMMFAVFALALCVAASAVYALPLAARDTTLNPDDGFPLWYQDSNGVSLGQCLDSVAFCGLLAETGFNPANPLAFPGNYPGEQFYYLAEVLMGPPYNLLYVAATEGSFAGAGNPAAGQQAVFSRIRIRADITLPGTYTVTHPYGTETFVVDTPGLRAINFSNDVFGLVALSFDGPLDLNAASAPLAGPFLESAGGRVTDPATGNVYLSNPAAPTAVIGAPTGNNFVRITGPDGTVTETNFTLVGKIIGNVASPSSLTFPTQKVGVASPAQIVTVTNVTGAAVTLGTIVSEGTNTADFQVATVPADGCSGATVPAAGTCTFGVVFSSTAPTPATRTASLLLTTATPAGLPPVRVNLSGTIDSVLPTVLSTFPADGQTVPSNTTITAVFSEPMLASTITTSTVTAVGPGGAVTGNVTFDGANNTMTFIPVPALVADQTYTVTITGGDLGVTDLAGNGLAADKVFSFATVVPDTIPPTVVSMSPVSNALAVPVNASISVVFSEEMHGASINATTFTVSGGVTASSITFDIATKTATFVPSAPLAPGTAFTVTVKGGPGGVDDLAQNTLAADVQWSFVTNHPPAVPALVSPADGATGLPTTVELKWVKATDDDGDVLEYHLELCNNQFFLGCEHQVVPVTAQAPMLNGTYLAGLGSFGLAMIGLVSFGGPKGRKRFLLLMLGIAIVSGTLVSACGRDKTTTLTVPGPSEAEIVFTASDLNPGAQYFWRVEVHDPNGGAAFTETRSFRTQ